MKMSTVISCEHAVNFIPDQYEKLFEGAEKVLKSHRGYDIGAYQLYERLKKCDVTYSQSATVSRLIVDVNRSQYRRTLFSEFTKGLSKDEKQHILADYYHGFRQPFETEVMRLWAKKSMVLHLSVHSFSPVLKGEVRQTDFGILYHPGRPNEKLFVRLFKQILNQVLPGLRVRFNYPYRGRPDGFVRHFRDMEEHNYIGIEFEMNQKYAGDIAIVNGIAESFRISANQLEEQLGLE